MAITQYKGTIQRPGQRPETVEIAAHTVPQLTNAEKAAGIQWVDGRYEPGDVRRYGAVGDAVTDCTTAIQNAINAAEQGGRVGGTVFVPKGTYLCTGKIRVGGWVTLRGETAFSSTLFWNSSYTSGNCIELGPDESGEFGYSSSYTFGSRIEQLDLNAQDVYRGDTSAVVYTNGAHQPSGVFRCQIRNFRNYGVRHDTGDGGPAGLSLEDCNFQGSSIAPTLGDKVGIYSDGGGAQFHILRCQIEGSSSDPIDYGVQMVADHLTAIDVHFEHCGKGFLLSQDETTVRANTIINATGHSTVDPLIERSSAKNNTLVVVNAYNESQSASNLTIINDIETGYTKDDGVVDYYNSEAFRRIVTPLTSELTIATGAVTVTQSYHTLDTEADAASDDLDTINGGEDGMRLVIRPASTVRTVVVKHNTGNIWTKTAADVTLDDREDTIELIYDSQISTWLEI